MDFLHSKSFEDEVRKLMELYHVPGTSVAVFDSNEMSAKGFGHASLSPETAAAPDTIYDVASTTKSLTAAAVGKFVADNETYPDVRWTTPVSRLLPDEFVLSDTYVTENATIEDILSHRTGMPRHDDSYYGIRAEHPDDPESVTRNCRNLPLSAPLRTKFLYCNIMYTVAAFLVEKLSKEPFADYLQKNIFDVLEMTSTFVQPSAVDTAGASHRHSVPYRWSESIKQLEKTERLEQPEAQGAGSVQSTVVDYAKWAKAVMTKDSRLFDAETYTQLTKPRMICEDDPEPFTSPTLYALGWETVFYRGHQIIKHDGSVTGYGSIMLFLPGLQRGVVAFGNASGASDATNFIAMKAVDEFLNVDVAERVDWGAKEEETETDSSTGPDRIDQLREELFAEEGKMSTGQLQPLAAYTGRYHNAGFHYMTVDIQREKLHIDAHDRSSPIDIFFHHVCGNKFVVHIIDDDSDPHAVDTRDDPDYMYDKAEFRVDGGGRVKAMGIQLDGSDGSSLIWFDKLDGQT